MDAIFDSMLGEVRASGLPGGVVFDPILGALRMGDGASPTPPPPESDSSESASSSSSGSSSSSSSSSSAVIPQDAVFYAPLASAQATAETGQTLDGYGVEYSTIGGIPCAVIDDYGALYGYDTLVTGNSAFSMSLWVRSTTASAIHWAFCIGDMGTPNGGTGCGIRYDGEFAFIVPYADDENTGLAVTTGEWTHLVYVYDGAGTGTTYVNGALARTFSCGDMAMESGWSIGASSGYENWSGSIAGVRAYDRVLTQAEITALAAEFTPSEA